MPTTLSIADFRKRIEKSAVSDSSKVFAFELACKSLDILGSGRRVTYVKEVMCQSGWSSIDVSLAMAELIQAKLLFEKSKGQTVSFKEQTKPRAAICVYCNRNTKRERLTRDHVIPRGQGGGDGGENIVWACFICNQAKADRSPAEWARDILDFRKAKKPLTRLPLRYRIKLAFTAAVVFVVGSEV